jgi:ribosomal protein S15P/S13E
MKASKMALGLFSSGFLLFSLYKYFSQKRITKEQISKIIKKISNLSIHFIFQKYDSQNKILNQKIENEEKNISNVLIKEQNNINNKSTFNKTEESFDNEILFVLLQIENEKIKSLGISNEEFQEYLLEYKDEDNEITKNLNLIQKVLNSFKQRKLPIINFGFIIPDKFIQIISNIYYFNLKASYLIFINKINSLKNNNDIFLSLGYKEKNEIFNNI